MTAGRAGASRDTRKVVTNSVASLVTVGSVKCFYLHRCNDSLEEASVFVVSMTAHKHTSVTLMNVYDLHVMRLGNTCKCEYLVTDFM